MQEEDVGEWIQRTDWNNTSKKIPALIKSIFHAYIL